MNFTVLDEENYLTSRKFIQLIHDLYNARCFVTLLVFVIKQFCDNFGIFKYQLADKLQVWSDDRSLWEVFNSKNKFPTIKFMMSVGGNGET